MKNNNLNFKEFKNDLLNISINKEPKIANIINLLKRIDNCKYCNMSGSGSACFGIFGDKKSLYYAKNMFKESIKIIGQHQSKQLISLLLGLSQAVRQRFLVPSS